MKYTHAFFDRDGVLIYADPSFRSYKNSIIEGYTGKPLLLDYDSMMELFRKAGYFDSPVDTLEKEKAFWPRYYGCLMEREGVSGDTLSIGEEIFKSTWLRGIRVYDDVIPCLEYFKSLGIRMGVISDTSPSLELTLEAAGIADYFDSFTCSAIVGAEKPDPLIYRTALSSLGARAETSLYVDDYDVEADGARCMGFTSFHLDRGGLCDEEWQIESLTGMVEYMRKNV